MTPQEYIDHLSTLATFVGGDITDIAIAPAAATLMVNIKNRIINEGRNSSGSEIGEYSTKPMYVTKDQFINPGGFNAIGKRGIIGDRLVPTVRLKEARALKYGYKFLPLLPSKKSYKRYSIVKSNYQDRKSMYLPEGYKQLRDIQGLRTDIVNITYRGDLMSDYVIGKDGLAYLMGLTKEAEVSKLRGLEKKYGLLLQGTAEEIANYSTQVNASLERLTRGLLNGVYVTATVESAA
jgi:hypothetical protein